MNDIINDVLEALKKIGPKTEVEEIKGLSEKLGSAISEIIDSKVKDELSSIKNLIDGENVDTEAIKKMAQSLEQNLKDDVDRANIQASIDARQDSTNKLQDERLDFVEKKITENINNDFKREGIQKGINFSVEKRLENLENKSLEFAQKLVALSNVDLSKFEKAIKKLKVWCIVNSILIGLEIGLIAHFYLKSK